MESDNTNMTVQSVYDDNIVFGLTPSTMLRHVVASLSGHKVPTKEFSRSPTPCCAVLRNISGSLQTPSS